MEQNTFACSLCGPDLDERIREWNEVAANARSRQVEKRRIVSTYPRDDQVIQRLRRLIDAEAQCCPFMTFTLTERADDVEVELRVPEEMSEALAVMLAAVTRDPSTSSG